MKRFFSNISGDKVIYRGYLSTFVLLLIALLYTIFYYRSLPPFIPLLNQSPWGEQRLVTSIGIFFPILIALAITVINLILCSFFYKQNPLVPRILTLTSFVIAILTFLFIIRTIQIVL